MEEIGHKIRAIEASVYEAVPKKKTCREFVRKNQAPCGKPCRGEVCGYHSHRRRGGQRKKKARAYGSAETASSAVEAVLGSIAASTISFTKRGAIFRCFHAWFAGGGLKTGRGFAKTAEETGSECEFIGTKKGDGAIVRSVRGYALQNHAGFTVWGWTHRHL